ncbi:MAG: putative Ig domain-containing protein [Acidimicrobiales bacterium]
MGEAPAFQSAASTTFAAGTADTFTVTTTGYPAPSISESGRLPRAVTFATEGNGKAVLSGTPTTSRPRTYTLELTAWNWAGTPVTQRFRLTVN